MKNNRREWLWHFRAAGEFIAEMDDSVSIVEVSNALHAIKRHAEQILLIDTEIRK